MSSGAASRLLSPLLGPLLDVVPPSVAAYLPYLVIFVFSFLGWSYLNSKPSRAAAPPEDEEDKEEEKGPLRNFTLEQLAKFKGDTDGEWSGTPEWEPMGKEPLG